MDFVRFFQLLSEMTYLIGGKLQDNFLIAGVVKVPYMELLLPGAKVLESESSSIQRVQIVLYPFSTRFALVYRFCIASLWGDPRCRREELENVLDWYRHDKGVQRKTGAIDR